MDGKGRVIDNIFIERLWRTIKYEHLYLFNYDSVINLMKGLRRFFLFCNEQGIHQALDYKTPIEIYTGVNRRKTPVLSFGSTSNKGTKCKSEL